MWAVFAFGACEAAASAGRASAARLDERRRRRLEFEPERELQYARIGCGGGNAHEVAAGYRCVRIRKVDVVEQVERLEAELEFRALVHREVLVQPEVEIERTRPDEVVAPEHTVSPERVHRKRILVQV